MWLPGLIGIVLEVSECCFGMAGDWGKVWTVLIIDSQSVFQVCSWALFASRWNVWDWEAKSSVFSWWPEWTISYFSLFYFLTNKGSFLVQWRADSMRYTSFISVFIISDSSLLNSIYFKYRLLLVTFIIPHMLIKVVDARLLKFCLYNRNKTSKMAFFKGGSFCVVNWELVWDMSLSWVMSAVSFAHVRVRGEIRHSQKPWRATLKVIR